MHWKSVSWSFGGAEGNRTPDLRIANAALSHLSYGPHLQGFQKKACEKWREYVSLVVRCQVFVEAHSAHSEVASRLVLAVVSPPHAIQRSGK
jgi:hypothetical protein